MGSMFDLGSRIAPGLFLGDVYVDSYRADICLNGTLDEQFVYAVDASKKYQMLYSSWKLPLSTQKQL